MPFIVPVPAVLDELRGFLIQLLTGDEQLQHLRIFDRRAIIHHTDTANSDLYSVRLNSVLS